MSRRNRAAGIRGPHSALTDFLAANNISAADIRDNYQRRLQQAEQEAQQRRDNGEDQDDNEDEAEEAEARLEDIRAERRRTEQQVSKLKKAKDKKVKEKAREKAKEKKLKEKAKQRAKNKASKRKRGDDWDGSNSSLSSESDDSGGSGSDFSEILPSKRQPIPGQFENCELCEKRFTVTPYSKTGPEGGLLCGPCGKKYDKDTKKDQKAAGPKPPARKRRNIESERLDGIVRRGAKSLVELCIEKVLMYHDDIESFDNMPEHLILRICRLFTKRRVMNETTLPLFLRGDMSQVEIFDCAGLKAQDYGLIFASIPKLTKLTLNNAYQFKDVGMDYMIDKSHELEDMRIYAANLVSSEKWSELFKKHGSNLKTIKLKWMDATFTDEQIGDLVKYCPNVSRLKLELLWNMTTECLVDIAKLKNLEHLSLMFHPDKVVNNEDLILLIEIVGPRLKTLSLRKFIDLDDEVLSAIHENCLNLEKLRITSNDTATDKGWTELFDGWRNRPLLNVDLSAVRDVDNQNPDGPQEEEGEEPVGFAARGFRALMKHSRTKLRKLNIASCRHVSLQALVDVFCEKAGRFPDLTDVDMSFVTEMDDFVLSGLTKSSPNLKRILLFGNFGIGSEVLAPKGVVVIGPPRVLDEGMEFYGNEDVDEVSEQIRKAMEEELGIGGDLMELE